MKRKDATATTRAFDLIQKERQFQRRLGFDNRRDDRLIAAELVSAAIVYARDAVEREKSRDFRAAVRDLRERPLYKPNGPGGTDTGYPLQSPRLDAPNDWPFLPKTYVPDGQRRNLVRAAALIVAELERLERLDDRLKNHGMRALDVEHIERIEKEEARAQAVNKVQYDTAAEKWGEDTYLNQIMPSDPHHGGKVYPNLGTSAYQNALMTIQTIGTNPTVTLGRGVVRAAGTLV